MRKLTTEEFVEKAKEIHENKYDYSQVEYKNNKTKVKIICPIHGEFWQRPRHHLRGGGCNECGKKSHNEKVSKNTKEFVEKAQKIHGDKYDYSKTIYNGWDEYLKITCYIHGEFEQKAEVHLKGSGCKRCYIENKKLTTEEFIEKAQKVHGDKYDYSKSLYKERRETIKIICPIHGNFTQEAGAHLMGYGCPKCNESHGEKKIRIFLEQNNIDYEYQKTFDECRKKRHLPFDFYLPQLNYLIEFDGKQHFEMNEYFGGEESFLKTKINEEIKDNFAKNNGIHLLRIPYWEEENINNILKHQFQ